MHGFDLAALLFAAFWVGAFVALLVRAMIADAAQRRLGRETVEAAEDARRKANISDLERSWRSQAWSSVYHSDNEQFLADALPGHDPARGGLVIGPTPRLEPYDDSCA